MKRRILILGGRLEEIPLISEAKGLGYWVVVCDMYGDNPGVALADRHYACPFHDRASVLRIAREERVEGVVSNSELAVPVVAYVSAKLGFVGNTLASVLQLMDKPRFRSMQQRLGLPCPRLFAVATYEELLSAVGELRFPILLKPAQSSGSRGVSLIDKPSDAQGLSTGFETCRQLSKTGIVVAEEFMPIRQDNTIGGEVFVYGGGIVYDFLNMTYRSSLAPMIPMTKMPMRDGALRAEALAAIGELVHASGVDFGELNVELGQLAEGGVFVLELNVRQGGNFYPHFVERATGINLSRLLVSLAMGDDSYYREVCTGNFTEKPILNHPVYSHRAGRYEGLYVAEQLAGHIVEWREKVSVGEQIRGARDATDVLGNVFMEFETAAEAEEVFYRVESLVYPVVS